MKRTNKIKTKLQQYFFYKSTSFFSEIAKDPIRALGKNTTSCFGSESLCVDMVTDFTEDIRKCPIYPHQEGYVFGRVYLLFVCLSVCLIVRRLTYKVMNEFARFFLKGVSRAKEQTKRFFVGDPD